MDNLNTVDDMAEIIWTAEQGMTGQFSAVLGRRQAEALVNEGYTINPEKASADEHDVFGVLVVTEDAITGVFRAQVARTVARTLVEKGISNQK